MRRVINGYRYDTDNENNEEIASASSDGKLSGSDIRWFQEKLYRSQTGRWFLAGQGGPMSHWGKNAVTGNGERVAGAGIRPLAAEQARHWLADEDVEWALAEYFDDD